MHSTLEDAKLDPNWPHFTHRCVLSQHYLKASFVSADENSVSAKHSFASDAGYHFQKPHLSRHFGALAHVAVFRWQTANF